MLSIAATEGRYGGAMAVGDGIDGIGIEKRSLDVNTALARWAEVVEELGPTFIVGYPSAIKIFGQLIHEGAARLAVKQVFSCGGPLAAGLRAYPEDVLAAKLTNIDGASESLALGAGVAANEGMILFDDVNVGEVIDGDMYPTSLDHHVQPLVRYTISDQLAPRNGATTDEVPSARAFRLLGRGEDVMCFTTPDSGPRSSLRSPSRGSRCGGSSTTRSGGLVDVVRDARLGL